MADVAERLETEEISEDEQKEIASEIDELFTKRSELPDQQTVRRRRGGGMPLLVNFAAAILLAIGIYVVLDSGRQLNTADDRALRTTESALLETVIAESAAEIAARDLQIQSIQEELLRLAALREASAGESTDQPLPGPSDRELELQAQLQELLAAIPEPSPATELDDLANLRSRQSFVVGQLKTLYQELSAAVGAADLDASTEGIAAIESLLESPAISQAGLSDVAATFSLGNAAMLIAIERTESVPIASEAETLLAQIQTLATQASARMEAGEVDAAIRLYTAVVQSMDETASAYQVLLARQGEEFSAERAALNDDLAALRRDIDAVRRDLAASRQTIAARDTSIASLQQQVLRLDATVTERESVIVDREETIADKDRTITDQESTITDHEETITARERTILDLTETIARRDRSAAGLDSRVAELQTESDRLQSYQSRLERLGSQVEADLRTAEAVAARATSSPVSQDSVVDLLGTKVQLREVADSDAVRGQYPSLYDDMELYFEAFGAEKELSGRRAAYQAASVALEKLIQSIDSSAAVGPATAASLEGYLTRLEALLTEMLEETE